MITLNYLKKKKKERGTKGSCVILIMGSRWCVQHLLQQKSFPAGSASAAVSHGGQGHSCCCWFGFAFIFFSPCFKNKSENTTMQVLQEHWQLGIGTEVLLTLTPQKDLEHGMGNDIFGSWVPTFLQAFGLWVFWGGLSSQVCHLVRPRWCPKWRPGMNL